MSIDLIATHHYLLAVLVGLPPVVVALLALRPLRTSILIAGLVEVLHAPPLIYFNIGYWNPPRIGDLAVGIEDVLVCFELGALTWAFAAWPMRRRISLSHDWSANLVRLLAIGMAGAAVAFVVWVLGAGVITVLVVVMAMLAGVLIALRPGLWRLSAWAILTYPAYYCAVLWLAGAIGRDFFSIWDGPELWGPRLLGLPVDEIAFVVAFAACYPLIIGYALDARIATASLESERPGTCAPGPSRLR